MFVINNKQKILTKPTIKYSYGAFNVIDKKDPSIQVVRITEGCPNNCPYCYESKKIKIFNIPKIERNIVRIIDMNLLCKGLKAKEIIKTLGSIKINKKIVKYWLVCGIDYRFLNLEFAKLLKQNRFIKPHLAWDWGLTEQFKIKDALKSLLKVGYNTKEISIFMICNWLISYEDNCKKLDLCKVWNIKVNDCWFDNQLSPNIIPIHWKKEEIVKFRKKVRKHNQLINFGIDPELKRCS